VTKEQTQQDANEAPIGAVASTAGLCVGAYANTPALRQHPNGWSCPLCGKAWIRHGRGSGFVKAGAFRHLDACWRNALAEKGLATGKWSDEHNAHVLTHNVV
jgi:hypothetical protein